SLHAPSTLVILHRSRLLIRPTPRLTLFPYTTLFRSSGDTADIREAPVYLLLGLALGSVWSRTDDQRVDPGGSGPSHRGVGRAHTAPSPREAPRTTNSELWVNR